MRAASKSRGVSKILVRAALWFCACNLLAAALAGQCTTPTPGPSGTYASGDHSASDNNALSVSNFVISGSATATLVAGNCIELLPGFHASAGTAGTTFHAWVETAPAAVSVSPASGSGLSQQFTWTVSSPAGYSNLADVFALFNTSDSGVNACYIRYNRASNLLSVADSSGSNWSSGIVPGSSGSTGSFSPNCTVNGTGSSVSLSGTQLAVTAAATFQSAFSGTKNQYLIAFDNEGLNTVSQQFGTWTVLVPSSSITFQSVPSGRMLQIDGTSCTTPCTISLSTGPHTVYASVGQNPPAGTQYNFTSWSDSNTSIVRTILVPGSLGYTANFQTQYRLTASAATGGTVAQSNAGGWYTSGTQATVTAVPNVGYVFSGFGASGNSNPLLVTMNGPVSLTASFDLIETISAPSALSGATAPAITVSSTYTSGGAASNMGHAVEYQFDWGDGTQSAWSGTASGSHSWSTGGARTVSVKARCVAHTTVMSVAQALAVNVVVPDFQISIPTEPITISPTGSLPNFQVSFTRINGFNQQVDLFAVSTPSGATGATVQLSSTTLLPNQAWSASMLVTPPLSQNGHWDSGQWDITVTAQSGLPPNPVYVHTAVARLTVAPPGPDFTLTLTPRINSVVAGQTAIYDVQVNAVNGFSSGVDLSISPGTLSGAVAVPGNLYSLTPGATSSFSVSTSASTASGNFSVSGMSGSLSHTYSVALNIGAVNTYTISGQVTQGDGSPLSGLSLAVSGDPSVVATTDGNGNYSIALPAGHYLVSPSRMYGTVSPASYSHDLPSNASRSYRVKPFRISQNVAPDPDPDHDPAPEIFHVFANGQPTAPIDFWWTDASINARDIQSPGCWAKFPGGAAAYANRDQSVTVSYTPDPAGPHFTMVFTAALNATPGYRNIVCRYNNRDVVGWPLLSVDAAPLLSGPTQISVLNNNQTFVFGPYYVYYVYNGVVGYYPASSVSCQTSGNGVSTAISGPSQYDSGDTDSFDLVLTAGPSGGGSSTAQPGPRTVSCTAGGTLVIPDSGPVTATVYDSNPIITSLQQFPSDSPDGSFPILISGTGFGGAGTVATCAPTASTCNGTPDLTVLTITSWTNISISARLKRSASAAGNYLVQVTSLGASGSSFFADPQTQGGGKSNPVKVVIGSPLVTLSLTRIDLTHIRAVGSPGGGIFSAGTQLLGNAPTGLTAPVPLMDVDASGATITIVAPANYMSGSPAPGSLAQVSIAYTAPSSYGSIINQFNVAFFGMSCYTRSLEADWGNLQQCENSQYRVKGRPGVFKVYQGTVTNPVREIEPIPDPLNANHVLAQFSSDPAGLPPFLANNLMLGTYCASFVKDVATQGSGQKRDLSFVHLYTCSPPGCPNNATFQAGPQNTTDGFALLAGQTLARDKTGILPAQNTRVELAWPSGPILADMHADDTGGDIKGYRFDLYGGNGNAACSTAPLAGSPIYSSNPIVVAACTPSTDKCPGKAIQ